MPRKIVKRLIQYASRRSLPGSLERNLTVKVFAAKKFHTSNQGVLFNQKLSSTQEYNRGKSHVPPLLSERAKFSFATFATVPMQHREAILRTKRAKVRIRGLPTKANAPTFAAEPLWQRRFYDEVVEYNEAQRKKFMTRTKERLQANPLWRYSQMDHSSRKGRPLGRTQYKKQEERGAMRWLGTLEKSTLKEGVTASKAEKKSKPTLSVRSALKAFADLELSKVPVQTSRRL